MFGRCLSLFGWLLLLESYHTCCLSKALPRYAQFANQFMYRNSLIAGVVLTDLHIYQQVLCLASESFNEEFSGQVF